MEPRRTSECNFVFTLPGGGSEGDLPAIRRPGDRTVRGDRGSTTSFWVRAHDDVALADATQVNVRLYGPTPVVEAGFGPSVEDAEIGRDIVIDAGPGQVAVELTPSFKEALLRGEFFILRVGAAPPPPVAVWLG